MSQEKSWKPYIGVIIQARTTSTRLPGKVLQEIHGRTVLERVVRRAETARIVDKVVIAVPRGSKVPHYGAEIFYGSEENVLERYYECAAFHGFDVIVRITADCPLVPPSEIDRCLDEFLDSGADYVTNRPAVPDGWDVEVFTYVSLRNAYLNATESFDVEHVTPYIKRNELLHKINLEAPKLSVDTLDDLNIVREFYDLERQDYSDNWWDRLFRH